MRKTLIFRGGCIVNNLATKQDTPMEIKETESSATILARDWKGTRNFQMNCVLEIYEVSDDGKGQQN